MLSYRNTFNVYYSFNITYIFYTSSTLTFLKYKLYCVYSIYVFVCVFQYVSKCNDITF